MLSYYASVAAHLLRQQSDVPVIFLTSKEEEIDELFGLKMGADDFIRKPFSPRLLVERVKVGRHQSQGSQRQGRWNGASCGWIQNDTSVHGRPKR